jgi:hypothetical protein
LITWPIADVEQARLETRLGHGVEHALRLFQRDAPVFRVAALRADVKRHAGEVRAALGREGDHFARLGCAGAELARQRPVAADVGGGDAQVELGIGLDLVHLAHLVGAVDHEPLDALARGVGDRFARLHRVGEEDLGRRHAQPEQQVELGGGGDLEAAAFLREDFQHAPVGVGLDRVVRPHAGHGRADAARRTMAVSTIRNGRVYFWLAARRTMSKSRLTSACVSKSCSCGCCLATALLLLRMMLGRSPIKVSPQDRKN